MISPAARKRALAILKSNGLSERAAYCLCRVSLRAKTYKFEQLAKDQPLEHN